MNWPEKIWEILLVTCIATICAWMYFLPQFWHLVSADSTFWSGINQIFFQGENFTLTLGGGIDQLGTIWIFSTVTDILEGKSESILPHIFHPVGFDLGKNTGFAWMDAVIAYPLVKIFGVPGFYNPHVFMTLFMTQVTAVLLFRTAGAPLFVSIGLSAFTIFNPFTVEEIYQGRPTQTYWLFHALFLLSVVKLSQSKNPILWATLGGICLACACMVYWFGGVAVGFCGAIAYAIFCFKGSERLKKLGGGIVLSVVTIALCLLFTWRISGPIIQGDGGTLFSQLRVPPQDVFSIFGIQIPIQSYTQLANMQDFWALLEGIKIGTPILALGIFSLFSPWGWRKRWPWIIGGLIALSIPFGPALVWPGGWTPTGFSFLHALFEPLTRCTLPHRMVVAPTLVLLLAAAMAIGAVIKTRQNESIRKVCSAAIGLSLLLWAVSQAPETKQSAKGYFGPDPELLEATRKWPGGIIDVPLFKSQRSYIQHVYHSQPILGGPGLISVRPFEHQLYCQRNSLLKRLEAMAKDGTTGGFKKKDLEQLVNDGFSLISIDLSKSKAGTKDYEELLKTTAKEDKRGRRIFIPLKEN